MRHIIRLNAGEEIKSFSELFISKIFEYTFLTFEYEQTIHKNFAPIVTHAGAKLFPKFWKREMAYHSPCYCIVQMCIYLGFHNTFPALVFLKKVLKNDSIEENIQYRDALHKLRNF